MRTQSSSGNATPSPEDIEVTKRLQEAGFIIGIELVDHLIIGDHQFISLKEKGIYVISKSLNIVQIDSKIKSKFTPLNLWTFGFFSLTKTFHTNLFW